MDHTSTDIIRRILSAIRTQPTCDGVDIHSIADENPLLAHDPFLDFAFGLVQINYLGSK